MRTRVFYNLPETACYGCQACAQICPVNAISMITNNEGFLFPKIDDKKCIECNLCEKTCPTQKSVVAPLFHNIPQEVDAAWGKNLTNRLESTSGGLFFCIAKKIIKENGIVYGVVLNKELKALHVREETLEGIEKMRGSKYVQSDITGIMPLVKEDVKCGKLVLFSGTPCQVAGLRAYLKRNYDNLICVDLVCHGTPSPMIFKSHVEYIKNTRGKNLVDYKFRGKEASGWRAYIKYFFNDGKYEKNFLGEDFYAYCFYHGWFNRLSCFSCGFSKAERVGDITLSDFWNAEKHYKQLKLQRKYGFNLVMCNTAKGKNLYNSILSELKSLTVPVGVAINGDVRLRHSESEPIERKKMFEEYAKFGYSWLVANRYKKPGLKSRLVPAFVKNFIYEVKARL